MMMTLAMAVVVMDENSTDDNKGPHPGGWRQRAHALVIKQRAHALVSSPCLLRLLPLLLALPLVRHMVLLPP